MRSPSEGLAHASHILCILTHACEETAGSFDATTAFQSYLTWLLDSFILLHDIRRRWVANLTLHESCMRVDEIFLGSINSLLSSLRVVIWPFILRKGYTTLSIICATILEDPSQLSVEFRQTVCSALLNITAVCKEYGSMRQVVSLNLVPAIKSTEETSSNLGQDFKASKRSILHIEGADFALDDMRISLSGLLRSHVTSQ